MGRSNAQSMQTHGGAAPQAGREHGGATLQGGRKRGDTVPQAGRGHTRKQPRPWSYCGIADPPIDAEKNAGEPRDTRRARLLANVLDAAERVQRCAVITPTDPTYQIARAHVRKGLLVNPFLLLYARAGYWKDLDKGARALHVLYGAQQTHPAWVFCCYSAALVHGLSVSHHLVRYVHVHASRLSHARNANGVVRHCTRASDPCTVSGLQVTDRDQTLLDCLVDAPLPEGLALADSALRFSHGTAEGLIKRLTHLGKGRRGLARAVQVAGLADARAENGGESILRGKIIVEGFMPPTDLQVPLPDVTNRHRSFRADMLWRLDDGTRIVGEFDGSGKYQNKEMLGDRSTLDVLLAERQRESRITALRMPVMRFTWKDLHTSGNVARILDAFGIPRVNGGCALR